MQKMRFFVHRETTVGNSGYCLYFDDTEEPGESFKIPADYEEEIARQCKPYFREVLGMTQGDFVQWRLGLENVELQKHIDRRIRIITVLAFLVGAAQLYYQIRGGN